MEKTNFGISLKISQTQKNGTISLDWLTKQRILLEESDGKLISFFIIITLPRNLKYMVLKAKTSAQYIESLFGFENDLMDIVNNVPLHNRKDHFQRHLDQVVMDINSSDRVFVKFDKTANFYKITTKNYNTLIAKE